ncbi:Uncharacterized protein APZ42_030770 [Daphnia magna]|uniref:Uncharacterized protein n=1 Tax=Daphnia magna TaxID=35525 RepID=A0A164NAQ5_9CRUS|nr:Uncharacterized protein APZ42_030770 [Daphnia magna]
MEGPHRQPIQLLFFLFCFVLFFFPAQPSSFASGNKKNIVIVLLYSGNMFVWLSIVVGAQFFKFFLRFMTGRLTKLLRTRFAIFPFLCVCVCC